MFSRGRHAAPRQKGKELRRFGRAIPLALAFVMTMGAVAFADSVVNDVQSEFGSENVPYTAGAAAVSVSFWIAEGNSGGLSGCDASDGSAATINFTIPSDVIASASSLTFTACNVPQSIQFSTLATATPGKKTISVASVTDTSGNYSFGSASFHLQVSAPADDNTPPTVTVADATVTVFEGQQATNSGTYGDVDGDTVSLSATLGTLTDNVDGTWSWARTEGDDRAATTVTVSANDGEETATASFTFTVNNANPTLNTPIFNYNPYSGEATAGIQFADAGWLDTHTAPFSWSGTSANGALSNGEMVAPDATGKFSSSHSFGAGCIDGAVSVRVSDDDGGYADHEFAAAGSLDRYTAAIQAPIKDGVRNIARLGNVIPVKIRVLDCEGTPVTDRNLTITLLRGNTTEENETNSEVIATSVSSADSGNTMRLADGMYMYNLATKGLVASQQYTILIKDGSNLVQSALIETKK